MSLNPKSSVQVSYRLTVYFVRAHKMPISAEEIDSFHPKLFEWLGVEAEKFNPPYFVVGESNFPGPMALKRLKIKGPLAAPSAVWRTFGELRQLTAAKLTDVQLKFDTGRGTMSASPPKILGEENLALFVGSLRWIQTALKLFHHLRGVQVIQLLHDLDAVHDLPDFRAIDLFDPGKTLKAEFSSTGGFYRGDFEKLFAGMQDPPVTRRTTAEVMRLIGSGR